MKDYTKENEWVRDMVMACRQDPNNADINGVALYHIIELIRADEREACAKLCDELANNQTNQSLLDPSDCAAAIRARSKHETT